MVRNITFWTPINPLRVKEQPYKDGNTGEFQKNWGNRPVFELYDEKDNWVARVAHETREDAELLARVFANSLIMRAALLDCATMLKAYTHPHLTGQSPDRGQAVSALMDANVVLQRTIPQPMAAPNENPLPTKRTTKQPKGDK